jgi:hypothetical protein
MVFKPNRNHMMKCRTFPTLWALLFLIAGTSSITAQNCASVINENKKVAGLHLLTTKPITIVVRGDYSYSLNFANTEDGIVARVFSKAGQEFNQDDEFIFVDKSNTRKSYRFIEMGEVDKEGNVPVYNLQYALVRHWIELWSRVKCYLIQNLK